MTPDEIERVRIQLAEGAAGLSEVCHVTSYTGYRNRSDGQVTEVNLDVLDAGPQAGPLRWTIVATDELGNIATGNPEADLDVAAQ